MERMQQDMSPLQKYNAITTMSGSKVTAVFYFIGVRGKNCKLCKSFYTWALTNNIACWGLLSFHQETICCYHTPPGPTGHPLYLRGGARKPLDLSQVGMSKPALPLR